MTSRTTRASGSAYRPAPAPMSSQVCSSVGGREQDGRAPARRCGAGRRRTATRPGRRSPASGSRGTAPPARGWRGRARPTRPRGDRRGRAPTRHRGSRYALESTEVLDGVDVGVRAVDADLADELGMRGQERPEPAVAASSSARRQIVRRARIGFGARVVRVARDDERACCGRAHRRRPRAASITAARTRGWSPGRMTAASTGCAASASSARSPIRTELDRPSCGSRVDHGDRRREVEARRTRRPAGRRSRSGRGRPRRRRR